MKALVYAAKSLASFVSWTRVLPPLGVQIPVAALPARLNCPLCAESSLHILNDMTLGGQWYSCESCGSQGDIIELAAKVWNLTLASTVLKLVDKGFAELPPERLTPESLGRYQVHADYRKRFLAGWERCKQSILGPQEGIGQLLTKLGLRAELTPERLREGPGKLLGAASAIEVERFYHSYSPSPGTNTEHNTSSCRVLVGRKWGNCLVIPYWDIPGRVAGMLFIGRQGDKTQGDWVYRVCYLVSSTGCNSLPAIKDSGLAMHPGVPRAVAARQVVVGMEDAVQMIKLQQKHFRTNADPLPLVAWYHGDISRSSACWRHFFPGRRIVLWSQEVTPKLVMQAVMQDADIALVGANKQDEESIKEWMARSQTKRLLEHMISTAKPWRTVVGNWLASASQDQIEELFHTLKLHGQPTEPLLQACSPETQKRLAIMLSPDSGYRCVAIDKHLVAEQADGWYVSRKNGSVKISDGILRLDKVVHQSKQGRTYYQGRILYKDQSVSFCERKEILEKAPFNWMQQKLLEAGLGLLQYDSAWNRQLINLATQLHPPEFVSAVDSVGWDVETGHYVFPQFAVCPGGVTKKLQFALISPDTPCAGFEPPKALSPMELQSLTSVTPANSSAWALLLATLAETVGPIFGYPVGGLMLSGDNVTVMAKAVGRTLGWGSQLVAMNSQTTIDTGHRWPTFYETRTGHLSAKAITSIEDTAYRVLSAPWQQAAAHYLRGDWTLIEGANFTDIPGAFSRSGEQLLLGYLCDLASRNYQVPIVDRCDIIEDVAAWLERQGVESGIVFDAARRINWDTQSARADMFGDMVARLHTENKMVTVRDGYAARNKLSTVLLSDENLFIPKEACMLLGQRLGILDSGEIGDLLLAAGVLIGEEEYDGRPGWLVKNEWWAKRLQRWRAAGLLRVHRENG